MDNPTLFPFPEPAPLVPIVSKLRRLYIYDRATFGHYRIDRVADGRVSLYLVYKNDWLCCRPFRESQFEALARFVAWRVNSARDIRIAEGVAYNNRADVHALALAA